MSSPCLLYKVLKSGPASGAHPLRPSLLTLIPAGYHHALFPSSPVAHIVGSWFLSNINST